MLLPAVRHHPAKPASPLKIPLTADTPDKVPNFHASVLSPAATSHPNGEMPVPLDLQDPAGLPKHRILRLRVPLPATAGFHPAAQTPRLLHTRLARTYGFASTSQSYLRKEP